jgi:hypothetical protein
MNAERYFPFFRRTFRRLTGRRARRIYVVLMLMLLLLVSVAWLRAYFIAQKVQAVLRGLAEIRVDQTTEERLKELVPYLIQRDWKVGGISQRAFYVKIPSEHPLGVKSLMGGLAYRMSFDAKVLISDRKVSQVDYGLANEWVWPQYAGYMGYIVSARSVHGFWKCDNNNLDNNNLDDALKTCAIFAHV